MSSRHQHQKQRSQLQQQGGSSALSFASGVVSSGLSVAASLAQRASNYISTSASSNTSNVSNSSPTTSNSSTSSSAASLNFSSLSDDDLMASSPSPHQPPPLPTSASHSTTNDTGVFLRGKNKGTSSPPPAPPATGTNSGAAPGLLYVGFNQDAACFGVGTVAGFRIYNTDPIHERARREHVPFLMFGDRAGDRMVKGPGGVPVSDYNPDGGDEKADVAANTGMPSDTENVIHMEDNDDDNDAKHDAHVGYDEDNVDAALLYENRDSESPIGTNEIGENDEDSGSPINMTSDNSMASALSYATTGSHKKEIPKPGAHASKMKGKEPIVAEQPRSPSRGASDASLSPLDAAAEDQAVADEEDGPPTQLPPRPELDRPGGITIVEMLYRTNYVALVGGGRNPKFPPNRLIIWDDLKGRVVMQLQFKSDIKAVRLRRDRMIIVFWNRVVVYTFSPRPQRLHTFDTMRNDRGLVALAPSPLAALNGRPGTALLAFPGRAVGQVQICDIVVGNVVSSLATGASSSSRTAIVTPAPPLPSFSRSHGSATSQKSLDPSTVTVAPSTSPNVLHQRTSALIPQINLPNPPISIIAAHNSYLSCLATSQSGHLTATASVTGTLIRVFESRSGRLVSELRRGLDHAEIYCIAFNIEGDRICVASDKGTIHIFNIGFAQQQAHGSGVSGNSGATRDPAVVAAANSANAAFPVGATVNGGVVVSGAGGNVVPRNINWDGSGNDSKVRPGFTRTGEEQEMGYSSRSTSSSSTRITPEGQPLQMPQQQQQAQKGNRHSTLSFFSPISKYFSSEWSFAQFTLPTESRTVCAFAATDRNDDGPSVAAKRVMDILSGSQNPPSGRQNIVPLVPPNSEVSDSELPKPIAGRRGSMPSYRTLPENGRWSPGAVVNANSVIALCADGTSWKISFDPRKGGTGTVESFIKFYRGVGDDERVLEGGVGVSESMGGGGGTVPSIPTPGSPPSQFSFMVDRWDPARED